ncbi:MAG: CHASE2 domain-containing protein, partial [Candidatus Omnitrophica bacterium]|nr:CHASE2 domain-containing protein [Candidatus Omnitrophota bacterium]
MAKKEKGSAAAPFEFHLASLRGRLVRNILIGVFIALGISLLGQIQLVRDGELLVYDWRMKNRPNRNNETPITLVMLEDGYLNVAGVAGLDRSKVSYLAELIRILSGKQAKIIGLDLMLSDIPDEDPNRRELENSMRDAGNVILSGRVFGAPEYKTVNR